MSEPRLLICLPWSSPRYIPVIARKCECGTVCGVDATNAQALDRGEFKAICQQCAFKDPRFIEQLAAEGIFVLHNGRPIEIRSKEDA